MWLLSTDRAELHFFSAPEAVDGGYASLSHTWEIQEEQQSFQKTQDLKQTYQEQRANPRDEASEKIRCACLLAEKHGYRWIWIDTCCIDKTSSVELSEAINSMFRWYSCSEVCYAYLGDVSTGCDVRKPGSEFRKSRWHTRGWTLQELIAPSLVMFVSKEWEPLGTKLELCDLLQEITGIWWQVLTREAHFSVISIAQRMSWASSRVTTRIEDEAYSLMGLFNVSMPTIYGEGRQAFQRLQHEIMKQSSDTSLFAWGRWASSDNLTPAHPQEIYRYFNTSSHNHVYLLAHSPRSFVKPFNGSIVRFTPNATQPLQPYLPWQWKKKQELEEEEDKRRREEGPFDRFELPRFAFTSYGVECRFPVIEVGEVTIAVLLCDTSREHIGLLLHPSNHIMQDPSRKKYHTGFGFRMASGMIGFARLISLGADLYNLRFNGQKVEAKWRDIYIADSAPPLWKDEAPSLCSPLNCILPAPPFRIPHWLVGRMTSLGFELRPLHMASKPDGKKPLLAVATFEDVSAKEGIRLFLGTCAQAVQSIAPSSPLHHWGKVIIQHDGNWSQRVDLTHDCSVHHIDSWPDWTKAFGDPNRTIRLSFRRCSLTPEPATTLVLHLELQGRVYEDIIGRTNVVLPSRDSLISPTSGADTSTTTDRLRAPSTPAPHPPNSETLVDSMDKLRIHEFSDTHANTH